MVSYDSLTLEGVSPNNSSLSKREVCQLILVEDVLSTFLIEQDD